MLGFGLVEFSCRFSGFGPNFMRIMRFDVKPKLERKQISPKSPMQIAQNKQPAKQKKRGETQRSRGEEEPDHQWAPRVARGHHHGPWWPPRPARGESHGRGGPSSPGCGGFSCDASFCPAINVRLLLVFGFKNGECIWSEGCVGS